MRTIKQLSLAIIFIVFCIVSVSQYMNDDEENNEKNRTYPKALSDYNDFKNLVAVVEKHRSNRLIDLNTFLEMSKEENVIILDTRSEFRYKRKHVKGAIHLNFSDFTQLNLYDLLSSVSYDENTKILIYCNNNFQGDQVDFTSKVVIPAESQILGERKPLMLALNIPTYINLYGYGYRNIYELDELVNINDHRIEFEGTVVE